MGALVPQQAAVLLAALLAVSLLGASATAWKAEAAAPPAVVVGSVKCLDCSPSDVDAFKGTCNAIRLPAHLHCWGLGSVAAHGIYGHDATRHSSKVLFPLCSASADLQVAIKCKSGADEGYETKARAPLDDTGVFRIPLAAELLRDDGSTDRDCFAQLRSSPDDTPCVGQAPPRMIAPTSQVDGSSSTNTTYYLAAAAAADTALSPVACACGKKKEKHFMFGPPPPPPRPTPTPAPTPTYGPPTPTPTPVPEPRPPAPEEPEPFFKKKPKLKFMHKKKPCPPLVDDDTTRRPAAAGGQGQEKVPMKLN